VFLFTLVDDSIFVEENAHDNVTFGVNKVGTLHFPKFVIVFSFSFYDLVPKPYIDLCVIFCIHWQFWTIKRHTLYSVDLKSGGPVSQQV
jgi:hypothetical protein